MKGASHKPTIIPAVPQDQATEARNTPKQPAVIASSIENINFWEVFCCSLIIVQREQSAHFMTDSRIWNTFSG